MQPPGANQRGPSASRAEKPAENLAESLLVMVICLVVAVGIIRLAVEEVNSLFARVATILGLGGN